MDQQQQSRWRPTRRQVLWTLGIVAVLTVAVLIGYRYGITLWDWIQLLIVPAVIAGGGIWFNRQQRERELEMAEQRTKEDRKIAQDRAETDREIADQRRQDDALQAYLDHIGGLLLDKDKPLRQSKEGDEVRTLARARTLTILSRLDGERKGRVMQFLYEAGLISRYDNLVNLEKADLRGAYLRGTTLKEAALDRVDLRKADLRGTDLREATFGSATLADANLTGAWLEWAYLGGTYLGRAILEGTILVEALMMNTVLKGANLSKANLRFAKFVTDTQLAKAKSLEGATMPNGQKYEEWLKSKGRGEDGDNSGPS